MEGHTAFVGSVPEKYDRYMGPIFFEPYAVDLVSRVPVSAGMRVLELACGTGIVTRHLRDSLPPEATLVATDLNEAMIARAGLKFTGDEAVEWRQADATRLPFEDDAFDAVICQFGFMFFPDKLAAFREAYRVLRRPGTIFFNVWDALEKNRLSLAAANAIARLFPDDAPDFYRIPFGFHEPETIRRMLSDAGFEDIEITTITKEGISASATDAAIALVEGTPMIGQILVREKVPVSDAIDSVRRAIVDEFGDGRVRSTLTALVCTAHKPARLTL